MGPDGKLRKKRRYRRTKKQMQIARELEEERRKTLGEDYQKPRGRGRPGRPPKNKSLPVSLIDGPINKIDRGKLSSSLEKC